MPDLVIPEVAARHLAYHARMAAAFAAAGDVVESASESLLVWTLLAQHGGEDAAASVRSDLLDERISAVPATVEALVQRRAHALALELQGHFVSEGLYDVATLYESVAADLSEHRRRPRPGTGQ